MKSQPWTPIAGVMLSVAVSTGTARAAVMAVDAGSFPGGSQLITFAGLADGTEVNGLIVGGVQFSYSLGNGQVVIDGGPGVTNNIAPPNVVSIGNPTGMLTLLLPDHTDRFGFGFAVLSTIAVANATTISIFDGGTPLGTLSYNGSLDPIFAGGFAGLLSTLPFDRVQLTFTAAVPAFAIDNVRIAPAATPAIPEPSTLLLTLSGAVGVVRALRRRTVPVRRTFRG